MTDASKHDAASSNPSTALISSEPQPKWWGASMTVWGALITGVATVLPTIAPVVGIDISSDVAQQLGSEALRVVQGVTGLAGIALTIFGRMRAVQPLERRVLSLRF